MAAVDYARLRRRLPRARLLFVAHREEILDQSLATFRHALRDPSFGEQWVGGARPTRFDHVFASIQSLNAGDLDLLAPDHFDVVIVDEFHHAAAPSYRRLLDHLDPVELLGLTATPERSDGLPDPALVRRPDRRRAPAVGRDRPAPPVAVLVLRHPRRPRPPRRPVAARPGLRRRGAHDRLHRERRVGSARRQGSSERTSTTGRDASARLLRERRARPVHGAPLPQPRHRRRRGVGRQPAGRAPGGPARPRRRRRASRLLGRPVQRGRRRPRRRHAPDAPPDREPDAVPPAARPRSAHARRARRSARCSTSSALTDAEFRFDRRYRALLGGSRARRRAGSRATASRSCRPAATWSSTVAQRDRAAQHPRGDPVALAGEGRRAPIAASGATASSRSPASSTRPASSSRTSTTGESAGRTSAQAAGAAGRSRPGPHEAVLRRAIGRLLHVDDDERFDGVSPGCSRRRTPPGCDDAAGSGAAAAAHARGRRHRPGVDHQATPACRRRVDLLWAPPAGARRAGRAVRRARRARSTTCTPACRRTPTCRCRSTPATRGSRSSRPSGWATGAKIAAWQTGVYEAKAANADLLAFTLDKTSGRLLADDPLPRLRHQPRPHPLGEPVRHARRQRHRPPLPAPRARRSSDPAVRPAPRRRPGVLVPRSGDLREPRRRTADGDHLGARASVAGRPLPAFAAAVA